MKYSFRNFLFVFLVSVVIFSVAAVFLMQYISGILLSTPISDESADPNISTEDSTVVPQEHSSALSYLILGLDEEGRAAYILLNRIDREEGTFLMSSIPANLRIELDGTYQRLGDVALTRGIDFLREKIYALTSLKSDYLFCVEADGLCDLVDRFGGFEYKVPQAMQEHDPDRGLSIDLAAGNQHLDGKKALDVLRFSAYPKNAEYYRAETFRELMVAMCRGILTEDNNLMRASETLPELFSDFTTDMTITEANKYLDTLFSFDAYELHEFGYPGKNEGDFFLPDTAEALAVYKPYR